MRLRSELGDSHAFRLHQLDRPVVVEIRAARVTLPGLSLLNDTARLFPRHRFTVVVRESALRKNKQLARVWSSVKDLPNVHTAELDDEKHRGQVIVERNRLHDELAKRASAVIASVEAG